MSHLYVTIMAGGSGTRFWPASRQLFPKQFLKLAGDLTLLQATWERVQGVTQPQQTWVITNQTLTSEVRKQLPDLPASSVIGEPAKRDTAPCVALAASLIRRRDPDAIMVVMPADHVIPDQHEFQRSLRFAASLVEADPTRLITFGIKPTYPAEVFGYIERDTTQPIAGELAAFAVKRFREKPNAATAQQFLDTGGFYWNAGIFVWRAQMIWDALWAFEPEMMKRIDAITAADETPEFAERLATEFPLIAGKSIDYAVMEKYPQVVVVEAPFRWHDVGNWTALEGLHPRDAQGNTVLGRSVAWQSSGCVIVGQPDHLVAVLGVQDLVVVQTPDATLVANKADEAAVKKIVELIESQRLQAFL